MKYICILMLLGALISCGNNIDSESLSEVSQQEVLVVESIENTETQIEMEDELDKLIEQVTLQEKQETEEVTSIEENNIQESVEIEIIEEEITPVETNKKTQRSGSSGY